MSLVCAVTMTYNESHKIKYWTKYYGDTIGAENCYIFDHGTDDGSTDNLNGFNVIRLPRSPQDNERRTQFLSEFCSSMLSWYKHVFYVDCDEILVPDPDKYENLAEFCRKKSPGQITSIGLDLLHRLGEEVALSDGKSITEQRSYLHYSSAMNKPNLTSEAINWVPGFHSSQRPVEFGDLFLFHLRYVDLQQALSRLKTTRNMPWAKANAGQHQRAEDNSLIQMMETWSRLPVNNDDPLNKEEGVLADYLKTFKNSERKSSDGTRYSVDTFTFGRELIRLPKRFVGKF